ncbi:MAG TPA: deoxyribodipyrimidine photo-lyase, partial [Chloroflexi bacterium]|nr:deoxyribodipyrimidine photo-lyase [Chloroflexota bacterium]
MHEGLRQLDADLRNRGSRGRTDNVRLIIRRGDPPEVLAQLVEETGARAIFAEEDFSPYAKARDAQVGRELPLHLLGGVVVHPPGSVRKADGDPYVVYTPFKRKWK